MTVNVAIVMAVVVLLGLLVAASVAIVFEYQRAVVFQLGRFWKVKGPGLVVVVPVLQQKVKIDLRTQVHEVPAQDAISRDNVSIRVDAVLYFRVVDPAKAFIQVVDYYGATSKLAQTTLRSVLGRHTLDDMLAERERLNQDIQKILAEQVQNWGVVVQNVEVRDIQLSENMVRAIAKQAEAERDRRAKVIHAEAEHQAAQTLVNAARILASDPGGMQLRYLQTLAEIAGQNHSTVVFPLPIDLIRPFLKATEAPSRDP